MSGFIHEDLPVVTEVEAPTRDEVLVVLEEGLRRIEGGWTRFAEYRVAGDGRDLYCAIGAVYRQPAGFKEKGVALRELDRATPRGYRDVMRFNDSRSRWFGQRQVVRVYKRAIKARTKLT